MISLMRAIVIAYIISIATSMGVVYTAEHNARLVAAELLLQHRNDAQEQFYEEREAMSENITRAINRKVGRAALERP